MTIETLKSPNPRNRIIISVIKSKFLSVSSVNSFLAMYDFDVFKSLSQYFYHAGVRKTDHPYTFKSSTVGSQTTQPFNCCIIEQITLKTGKTKV